MKKTISIAIFAMILSFTNIGESFAAVTCNATGSGSVGIDENGNSCSSCGANCSWKIDDNGKLTISGSGGMDNYSWDGSIQTGNTPWSSYKSDVTSIKIEGIQNISDYAFENFSNNTQVDIGNSVTSVGKNAFNGNQLTSVDLPKGVTSIGRYAFHGQKDENGNNTLQSVTLPENTTIGDFSFASGYLSEIIVPDTIVKKYPNGSSKWSGNAFFGYNSNATIKCQGENGQEGNVEACENALSGFQRKSIEAMSCQTGCDFCGTGGKCLSCASGKYNEEGVCVESCSAKHYADDTYSECKAFPEGCEDYSNGMCNVCGTGYISDASGKKCKVMPVGCVEANGRICVTCESNYYKKENGCVSAQEGCGDGYLEKDSVCISSANGCGAGYKDMGGFCNRIQYTPAEAAPLLHNDNTNSVTITFKK